MCNIEHSLSNGVGVRVRVGVRVGGCVEVWDRVKDVPGVSGHQVRVKVGI